MKTWTGCPVHAGKEDQTLENSNEQKMDSANGQSKGFGGGMIMGMLLGAALFLATVQILYWVK